MSPVVCSRWTCLSHDTSWFDLAQVWSTNLRSRFPNESVSSDPSQLTIQNVERTVAERRPDYEGITAGTFRPSFVSTHQNRSIMRTLLLCCLLSLTATSAMAQVPVDVRVEKTQ
jgi:hypothetical protein